ncbi:MAG: peptide chain release factor N(5)-glutamine methyltransferase [Gemmatimonadota bacterium]
MTATRPEVGAGVAPPPEGEAWTVLHLVRWSAEYLAGKGVEGGRLDAEHLLADTLSTTRLQLYLDFDRPLSPEELDRFRPRLLERGRRKPLQYILGHTAFRELVLRTDARVLIPRPETEELVECVLRWARAEPAPEGLRALDLGTGSGAIALSLAMEGAFRQVVATDVSDPALDLARENAQVTGLAERVEFRSGNLYGALTAGERFDVVVSNPPYISETDFSGLAPEVREWEPREALVAEEGGFALAFAVVDGAPGCLEVGGILALEVGEGQAARVADRIRGMPEFASPEILRDLARRERIVTARRIG